MFNRIIHLTTIILHIHRSWSYSPQHPFSSFIPFILASIQTFPILYCICLNLDVCLNEGTTFCLSSFYAISCFPNSFRKDSLYKSSTLLLSYKLNLSPHRNLNIDSPCEKSITFIFPSLPCLTKVIAPVPSNILYEIIIAELKTPLCNIVTCMSHVLGDLGCFHIFHIMNN